MADVPRVILLMCPYAGFDRGMLQGIVRYARTHGPWIFYLAGDEPGLPLPEIAPRSGRLRDITTDLPKTAYPGLRRSDRIVKEADGGRRQEVIQEIPVHNRSCPASTCWS